MKHPEYIFEAFCAFPSILLDTVVEGIHKIFVEERQLAARGEFDEEELAIETGLNE